MSADQHALDQRSVEWLTGVRDNVVWVVLVGLVVVLGIAAPEFATRENVLGVLQQSVVIGLLAVGLTFVFIGGSFDLSVGATLTLGAVVAIGLEPTSPSAAVLAMAVAVAAGFAVGAVNGIIVGGLGANALIATLGMTSVIAAVALIYSGAEHMSVFDPDPLFSVLGRSSALGVPVGVLVLLAAVAIAQVVLTRTVFGQQLFGVGSSESVATHAGLPVGRLRFCTFLIAAAAASVAGVVVASRVHNVDPAVGLGYEFDAITAVVLGGTSLFGGRGSAVGTLGGVLLLAVLSNGMNLLGVSYYGQQVVQGALLLLAVGLDVRVNGGRA
jgi:ribose transport system permease protein